MQVHMHMYSKHLKCCVTNGWFISSLSLDARIVTLLLILTIGTPTLRISQGYYHDPV